MYPITTKEFEKRPKKLLTVDILLVGERQLLKNYLLLFHVLIFHDKYVSSVTFFKEKNNSDQRLGNYYSIPEKQNNFGLCQSLDTNPPDF